MDEVSGDYLEHVLQVLMSCPIEVLDLVKQSIRQGGDALKDLQPPVVNSISETLVEKSVEVRFLLKLVSSCLSLCIVQS